jgi:hypothetical protein
MFAFSKLPTVCAGVLLFARLAAASDTAVIAKGDSTQAPRQPQLAIDEAGTIHVTFGQKNVVLYSQSRDGGQTYSKAMQLPEINVLALGMRRGPRIAASQNNVCISLVGGKQGKGKDGDVLAFNSMNGGQTWSGPVAINEVPGSGREGLHAMAASSRGPMFCVWLDLRDRKTEVYSAVSADGGKTWEKNICVYRSPDGSVCECCHPSVAYDAAGGLHVMWRNSLGGARDMYVASSSDGGKAFSTARKLGNGTWPLKACPMDGGSIAASPRGDIYTAWRRDTEVFLSTPKTASEQRLGAGKQPWIALTNAGPIVVWKENKTGRLLLQRPEDSMPQELASNASDPVIVSSPTGRGPVVAAWEERRGMETVIVCNTVARQE